MQRLPRVGLELLHAERNTALLGIHVNHNALDVVIDFDNFRRVLHTLGPSHLADVHQAFNTLFEFDECAVVRDADYTTVYVRSNRVALRGI